ncbi:sin3 histone deacetylase corepressor complex component SDS3 [Ciona intestinalis]
MAGSEYDTFDDDEVKKVHGSDNEDTDDASETDRAKREEATEIKEQIYREKLAQIKQQVALLHAENHPEFCRKQKKLETIHKERQKQLQVYHNYLVNKVEQEHRYEQELAIEEFEAKKIELKGNLISELQEKKKQIETERHSMELTGGFTSSTETKAFTRQLRRRANEPAPTQNEKRRKASPTQINFTLAEDEIIHDLKILNKEKAPKDLDRDYVPDQQTINHQDCRLENGKLYFEKRWFHAGQPIFYDCYKDGTRIAAEIVAISDREIWIRKVSDGTKLRIFASQLNRGKCGIKQRTLQ